MKSVVRIGCFAAFWGDSRSAIHGILEGAEVEYLVADYLSEITMALLARARAKDPEAGFVGDFITTLQPVLPEIAKRGIKVVTNAGALNPVACARALRKVAQEAGTSLRIVAVEGDDLLPRADEIIAASVTDMITGAPLPKRVESLNAYLGAGPIAAALAQGADVVITGRCVDAAVVLGPLMHEFGWKDDQYDLLSSGTLVGHILECGPQATGGNVTDWEDVPGWDNMGYPIAECFPDGTAIITKPANTGGLVIPPTVAEQILYEIGDPGAYLMADVVCDWRNVRLVQEGENRVRASGAKGSAPTTTYKVTGTHIEGSRVIASLLFAGEGAAGKARRMATALLTRVSRLAEKAGKGPIDESSIEVVGSGDILNGKGNDAAQEAVVKIGARSRDRETLEIFASELASMALVAQGMTGLFAGRPRVAPAIAVYHLKAEKKVVSVQLVAVHDDRETRMAVPVASGTTSATTSTPTLAEGAPARTAGTVSVPLLAIARGRSGDKGNLANIGLLARTPELAKVIEEQVTAERVKAHFAHISKGPVRRWALPGLSAINIILDDILGGTGGTSTLRYDPQGKSYAAMLLSLPVDVPEALLAGAKKR